MKKSVFIAACAAAVCVVAECAPARIEVKTGESLVAVRDRVRALPAEEKAKGVEIVLADGEYRLDRPLELSAADSGTNGAMIVWRAANRTKANEREEREFPKEQLTAARTQPSGQRIEHPVVVHNLYDGIRSNEEQDDLTCLINVLDNHIGCNIIIRLTNQLIVGIAHQTEEVRPMEHIHNPCADSAEHGNRSTVDMTDLYGTHHDTAYKHNGNNDDGGNEHSL